jgi:hypothetical protein
LSTYDLGNKYNTREAGIEPSKKIQSKHPKGGVHKLDVGKDNADSPRALFY